MLAVNKTYLSDIHQHARDKWHASISNDLLSSGCEHIDAEVTKQLADYLEKLVGNINQVDFMTPGKSWWTPDTTKEDLISAMIYHLHSSDFEQVVIIGSMLNFRRIIGQEDGVELTSNAATTT